MTCCNDKDMADRCKVKDANQVVWCVKATAKFNNEIQPLFEKLLNIRQENLKLTELKQLYLKKFFG